MSVSHGRRLVVLFNLNIAILVMGFVMIVLCNVRPMPRERWTAVLSKVLSSITFRLEDHVNGNGPLFLVVSHGIVMVTRRLEPTLDSIPRTNKRNAGLFSM